MSVISEMERCQAKPFYEGGLYKFYHIEYSKFLCDDSNKSLVVSARLGLL